MKKTMLIEEICKIRGPNMVNHNEEEFFLKFSLFSFCIENYA